MTSSEFAINSIIKILDDINKSIHQSEETDWEAIKLIIKTAVIKLQKQFYSYAYTQIIDLIIADKIIQTLGVGEDQLVENIKSNNANGKACSKEIESLQMEFIYEHLKNQFQKELSEISENGYVGGIDTVDAEKFYELAISVENKLCNLCNKIINKNPLSIAEMEKSISDLIKEAQQVKETQEVQKFKDASILMRLSGKYLKVLLESMDYEYQKRKSELYKELFNKYNQSLSSIVVSSKGEGINNQLNGATISNLKQEDPDDKSVSLILHNSSNGIEQDMKYNMLADRLIDKKSIENNIQCNDKLIFLNTLKSQYDETEKSHKLLQAWLWTIMNNVYEDAITDICKTIAKNCNSNLSILETQFSSWLIVENYSQLIKLTMLKLSIEVKIELITIFAKIEDNKTKQLNSLDPNGEQLTPSLCKAKNNLSTNCKSIYKTLEIILKLKLFSFYALVSEAYIDSLFDIDKYISYNKQHLKFGKPMTKDHLKREQEKLLKRDELYCCYTDILLGDSNACEYSWKLKSLILMYEIRIRNMMMADCQEDNINQSDLDKNNKKESLHEEINKLKKKAERDCEEMIKKHISNITDNYDTILNPANQHKEVAENNLPRTNMEKPHTEKYSNEIVALQPASLDKNHQDDLCAQDRQPYSA